MRSSYLNPTANANLPHPHPHPHPHPQGEITVRKLAMNYLSRPLQAKTRVERCAKENGRHAILGLEPCAEMVPGFDRTALPIILWRPPSFPRL